MKKIIRILYLLVLILDFLVIFVDTVSQKQYIYVGRCHCTVHELNTKFWEICLELTYHVWTNMMCNSNQIILLSLLWWFLVIVTQSLIYVNVCDIYILLFFPISSHFISFSCEAISVVMSVMFVCEGLSCYCIINYHIALLCSFWFVYLSWKKVTVYDYVDSWNRTEWSMNELMKIHTTFEGSWVQL